MRIAAVGSGRSVHALTRSAAFAARGHDVRFVTLGPVLPDPPLPVLTRDVPRSPGAAFSAVRSFVRDVDSFGADLLHVHYAGGRLASLGAAATTRPLVLTVMGGDVLPEQHPGGLSRLERAATGRLLRSADLILVKSDALRAAVAAFGAGDRWTETVRWGVDTQAFQRDPAQGHAWRARLGLAEDDHVVFSPRAVAPLYGTALLVDMFAVVRHDDARARLVLAGEGAGATYEPDVRRRVVDAGLEGAVRWTGRVDHAGMAGLYSAADVVVMAPSSDGIPQSLFEAMACGTAVVLGALPGYREVVTDGVEALFAERDAEALAAATLRVLGDADLRTRLTRAAYARVLQVGALATDVARVESFYSRLLERPRCRPSATRWLDVLSIPAR